MYLKLELDYANVEKARARLDVQYTYVVIEPNCTNIIKARARLYILSKSQSLTVRLYIIKARA